MAENAYTDRQRGQSYLIQHLDSILDATGRTAGYDNKKPDKKPLGPPPVVITRVVGESRTVNGIISTPMLTSDPDANTIIGSLTPKHYFDIFDQVPEEILDNLLPAVTLYKVYPTSDKKGYPVKFDNTWLGKGSTAHLKKVDAHTRKQASARDWEKHFATLGDAPKVGITGLTIKKLGGNPAEVESNIQVSLTIETMDLNNLFFRHLPPDFNPDDPDQPELLSGDLSSGIAWIDLIKLSPHLTGDSYSGQGDCDRVYDENTTQIKLVLGYPVGNKKALKRTLLSPATKGSAFVPSQSWLDGQYALSESTNGAEGIDPTSDHAKKIQTRIDTKAPSGTSGLSANEQADQVIKILDNHKETLHLTLQNHDLVIEPDLSVRLTINFIGYGQALQRTTKADLLNDPALNIKLDTLTTRMTNLNQRSGALQKSDVDVDAMPDDTDDQKAAKEKAKNEAKAKNACAQDLEEQVNKIQKEYEQWQIRAKRKLSEQIKLNQADSTSRIYEIAIPDSDPIWSQPLNSPQTGERVSLIKNFRAPWATDLLDPAKDKMKEAERIQQGLNEELVGDYKEEYSGLNVLAATDFDTWRESKKDELTQNLTSLAGYKIVQFIFLGDILEAALEVVAFNNRFNGSAALLAPRFFTEVDKKGNLGTSATETIRHFGKYIFGDIKLPQYHIGQDKERYINIADIPIDLEAFRNYWYNEVISRPKVKRFYLQNLITGMINNLIPYAIDNRLNDTANSTSADKPQAIVSHLTLGGDSSALLLRGKTIPPPPDPPPPPKPKNIDEALQQLVAKGYTGESNKSFTELSPVAQQIRLEQHGVDYNVLEGAAQIPVTSTGGADPPPPSADYTGYLKQKQVNHNITIAHNIAIESEGQNTYNVFAITQKPASALKREGNAAKDKKDNIFHFRMSSGEKGMFLSAQFKRNDFPALQTANLTSDGGANKLGLLREKYDATVLLRGNVAYKPGAVLYIDPSSLQNEITLLPNNAISLGRQQYWEGDSAVGTAFSAARMLGLGGYFVVISVSHDFGDLGSKADWKTTLETKWLSFAHIPGLEPCKVKKPKDDVALSPEDEACITQTLFEEEAEAVRAQAVATQAAEGTSPTTSTGIPISYGGSAPSSKHRQ